MRLYLVGSLCVVGLGAGCADSGDVDSWNHEGTDVRIEVDPLDPSAASMDYLFDLRVVGPNGQLVTQEDGLAAAAYGNDRGAILYVVACQPGLNQVGVGVRDIVDGVAGGGMVPEGLVQPMRLNLTGSCFENTDAPLSLGAELATLREDSAGAAVIAFADITCTTKQACGETGVSVEVACSRSAEAGMGVSLGVSGTRVVCGGTALAFDPQGETTAFETKFKSTASSNGATSRWSMAADATATDLSGCRLEASIIAAPDLLGGFGPACKAWPVLELNLPLAPSECADASVVSVGYRHGMEFASELVIDARGPYTPTPTSGWSPNCGVSSDVWSLAATVATGIQSNDPVGFFDISFEVSLPD